MLKRIVRNFSWMMFSEILSQLMAFLLVVVAARYLGDIGLGQFSFALAFAETVFIFADFGLNAWFIREASREPSKSYVYLSNINGIRTVAGIVCFIAVLIMGVISGMSNDKLIVTMLLSGGLFLALLTSGMRCIFAAYEQMSFMAFEKIIKTGGNLLIGFAVLHYGYGVIAFTFATLLSYVLAFLFVLAVSKGKFVGFGFRFDMNVWQEIIKASVPFWLQGMIMQLQQRSGILILSFLKGDAVTGWFSVADQLVRSLYFIPMNLVTAVFPAMSKLFGRADDSLKKVFTKTWDYLFIIILPIAVGSTLLGPRIIEFFYKSRFVESGIILQVLIWSQVFLFLNYLLGYYLISIHRQKVIVLSSGIATIANIVLNFTLVPFYSYIGTAIAAIIAGAIDFGVMMLNISGDYRRVVLISTIKPVICGIIMGVFVFLLRDLHIIYLVPAAAVVYFIFLVLLGVIGKEESNLIRMIWKKS